MHWIQDLNTVDDGWQRRVVKKYERMAIGHVLMYDLMSMSHK